MEVTWVKSGATRTDVISQESLTVEQLVYLAGFFDGEGSIGLYHEITNAPRRAWKARITITQNRSKHIDRLFGLWARVFGGSVGIKDSGRVVDLTIRKRASCVAFLQYVGPYCSGKRRQMVVLENWLSDHMYSYRTAQTLKALKDIQHGRVRNQSKV